MVQSHVDDILGMVGAVLHRSFFFIDRNLTGVMNENIDNPENPLDRFFHIVAEHPYYTTLAIASLLVIMYFACMGIAWFMIKKDIRRIEMQDESPYEGDEDAYLKTLYDRIDQNEHEFATNIVSRANPQAFVALAVHAGVFVLVTAFLMFVHVYCDIWTWQDCIVPILLVFFAYALVGTKLWWDSKKVVVLRTGLYLYGASAFIMLWTLLYIVVGVISSSQLKQNV